MLDQELRLLVLSKQLSISQQPPPGDCPTILKKGRLDLLQALYLALGLKDMGQNLDIEHLALNLYY